MARFDAPAGGRAQAGTIVAVDGKSHSGTIEFKKENFVAAQGDLQKSIDVFPSNPDPVVVLRLALALDKQDKYPLFMTVYPKLKRRKNSKKRNQRS